jgi:hypothetical protein
MKAHIDERAPWLRIDKAHGVVQQTESGLVFCAATGFTPNAAVALTSGRFETPGAIYTRPECVQPDDPPAAGALARASVR